MVMPTRSSEAAGGPAPPHGRAGPLRTVAMLAPRGAGALRGLSSHSLAWWGLQVGPEPRDLIGGLGAWVELDSGAAIRHRRGEVDPMVQHHGSHRPVLRQSDRRLGRDAGAGGCRIDDEDDRLSGALG